MRRWGAPINSHYRSAAPQVAGVWGSCGCCHGAPALRRGFVLQSCLCPTPDLRSFHMGIALSTLSILPRPLRSLVRRLQQQLLLEAAPETRASSAPTSPSPREAAPSGRQIQTPQSPRENRPPAPAAVRPLRGSWPFNVRPAPTSTPSSLLSHRQQSAGNRSFLPSSTPRGCREAFLASLAEERGTPITPRVLRRVSERGTGKLVITGRMADVCAELDRLADLEGLQAH